MRKGLFIFLIVAASLIAFSKRKNNMPAAVKAICAGDTATDRRGNNKPHAPKPIIYVSFIHEGLLRNL